MLPMAHRIGARLADASPAQLLTFIEKQAPLWSPAALRTAEKHTNIGGYSVVEPPDVLRVIGARLSGLARKQRAAFLDEQAPLWSPAALRVAEEHAARLAEQPEWILSEVLLSPDLAPHILAQLPTTEHGVKGTCRAWRRGWKETLKKRQRPRLLVIGGQDSEGGTVNSLERYDPSTNA